jgi:type I restriction enzyme S subunit
MVSKEDIPNHWGWQKLDDIGKIYSGGTPDRENESYFGGEITWLRLKDAKEFYVDSAEENITKKGLNNSSAQLLPKGTVIVSTRATIGRVTISATEVATNQGFKAVYPEDCIPEYVAHYMNSIEEELNQKGRTTTYAEINKTQFKNTEIPIPPIEEQKAIVEKLDKIFDSIGKIQDAKEQAEGIESLLIRSAMNQVNQDLESKAKIKKIKDVCQVNEKNRQPKKEFPEEEFKYITVSDVDGDQGKIVSQETLKGKEAPSRAKRQIKADDVIISTTRPYLRAYAKVPKDLEGEICSTAFAVLNPGKKITTDYLYYAVRSDFFVNQLKSKQRGASYPAVGIRDVKKSEIYVPEKDKQKEIIKNIRIFEKHTTDLVKMNSKQSEIIEDLPKSILADAFKGDLVHFKPKEGSQKSSETENQDEDTSRPNLD